MAINDYDQIADNNTDINGINIGEGWASSNVNNAIREIMADLKVFSGTIPDTENFVNSNGAVFNGTQPRYFGRGPLLHHNDQSLVSARIFVQQSGGAAPSGMANGDILFEWS